MGIVTSKAGAVCGVEHVSAGCQPSWRMFSCAQCWFAPVWLWLAAIDVDPKTLCDVHDVSDELGWLGRLLSSPTLSSA